MQSEVVGIGSRDDSVDHGVFGFVDGVGGEVDRVHGIQLSVVGTVFSLLQVPFRAVLVAYLGKAVLRPLDSG